MGVDLRQIPRQNSAHSTHALDHDTAQSRIGFLPQVDGQQLNLILPACLLASTATSSWKGPILYLLVPNSLFPSNFPACQRINFRTVAVRANSDSGLRPAVSLNRAGVGGASSSCRCSESIFLLVFLCSRELGVGNGGLISRLAATLTRNYLQVLSPRNRKG